MYNRKEVIVLYQENIELVWFLIGVFVYRTVAALIAYSHMANFVNDVYEQSLKFIGVIAEDVSFIRAMKYRHMYEAGFDDRQIDEIRQIDTRTFFIWKNSCVSHMLVNCPKYFRSHIKFQDWPGAMRELNRIYEKEKSKNDKKEK